MNTTNRFARKLELLFIVLDLSFFAGISVGILFLPLFMSKNKVLKLFKYLNDLIDTIYGDRKCAQMN
jgi:hypothetical protein